MSARPETVRLAKTDRSAKFRAAVVSRWGGAAVPSYYRLPSQLRTGGPPWRRHIAMIRCGTAPSKPSGRGVAMTEAGQAALARADMIFPIGLAIPDEVREAASGKVARLAVGLSDGISKLAAHALLEPVLATPSLRLVCREVELEQLLAELALHHLDLVLAGQPAPRNPNLRLTSERLVESTVEWYGPAAHVHRADVDQFPQSLNRPPVLLPTGHSALRPTLDRWFETQGLRPRIVGEFEDSALQAVFAARGLGVFPVSRLGSDPVGLMRGLRLLGRCVDVKEGFHAIRSRRGQHHPLVMQVVAAARP